MTDIIVISMIVLQKTQLKETVRVSRLWQVNRDLLLLKNDKKV